MTLRARLAGAFLVVVLLPVLVGALLVARLVPELQQRQDQQRLAAAGNAITLAVQGLCQRSRGAAEALALAAAASGGQPGTAPTSVVQRGLADGAALVGSAGSVSAAAGTVPTSLLPGGTGTLPGGPAGLVDCRLLPGNPAVLGSGVRLQGPGGVDGGLSWAGFAVDARLAARLARVTGTDVTLAAGGSPVGSTLSADQARQVAAGGRPAGLLTRTVGESSGQPLTVVTSTARFAPGWLFAVLAAVVVVLLLLCLAIVYWLSRAVTRPIAEVGEAAERVATGELTTRLPVRRRDEVGRLAESFNLMTAELRAYVDALRASRDQLRRNLDLLGDTLSSTHDLNRILAVVLDTAMTAAGAQAGAIFINAGNDLYCKAGRGPQFAGQTEEQLALRRVLIGQGIVGRVAETGEPARARRGGSGPQPAPGEPEAATYIAVPFKSSGRMLGVLALYDRLGSDEFDDADLTTIRTFAGHAAVAVDNVQLHHEAQRLSLTDGLTGLWNFRYFQMSFSREIERAARFGRPLALLMLDLDRFKQVNDTYGHQRGDAVLIELSRRIQGEIREVDVLARYGGEELVLVLPETDEEGARRAAERICSVVRREPVGKGTPDEVAVTVSIGVAVFPEHGTTVAALVDRADDALYAAKSAGRDTWRLAGNTDSVPL